ncbi:PREDICTED: uncharacterized protein LOC108367438 [Rhagoletis zephyria]|uniref:uncharacterized protein LOC108367438 n=1 Tax=Rhagoletis zephyria TaxID=28612 RepID=UPI0008117388|nr:PREDICTED: uncharacterized protein LOC108367438 [Rhagoletis zephyria]
MKTTKEWDLTLLTLQWSLNSQSNATTKMSPNEIVFNYNLRDYSQNRLIQALHDEPDPQDENKRDELLTRAKENIEAAQSKWQQRFNERHQQPTRHIEGELVMISNVSTATGETHKLDAKYKGPYVVTKILDHDRYIVEDIPDAPVTQQRYCSVLSSEQMKRWCQLNPQLEVDDSDGSSSDA